MEKKNVLLAILKNKDEIMSKDKKVSNDAIFKAFLDAKNKK